MLIRVLICIGVFGFFLYSYIDKQNEITQRRLQIPVIAKQIEDLKEANIGLRYDIDLFESPEHLIQLARQPEYSHMKQPMFKEILAMPEGLAVQVSPEPKVASPDRSKGWNLASVKVP